MTELQATSKDLFFSKGDLNDPRLGELNCLEMSEAELVILGFADDTGVKLNGGRVGAQQGPTEIRRPLYRMTPHPRKRLRKYVDAGDLTPQNGKEESELGNRHKLASHFILEGLQAGRRFLTLGGGNDYAYADGAAYLNHSQGTARPLVINVDAHLDVRPLDHGLSSGTPFYRLLEEFENFDFVELGQQTTANAKAHWDYVLAKGGHILSVEEQLLSGLSWLEFTVQRLGDSFLRARSCYLSIDMDVFASPYAFGTSAALPLGILPHEFWPLFDFLLSRLDVRILGLYEVAPELDPTGHTVKLAAQFAHAYLHDREA